MVHTHKFRVTTRGQGDAFDITNRVATGVDAAALQAGIVTIFVVGSTAAVTTIEFEPGAVQDFNALLDRLAPRGDDYQHHARWHDDNGSSHVRAALIGPSVTIPFVDGSMLLGEWQQIMLLELDTRPRDRQIVVQVVGE